MPLSNKYRGIGASEPVSMTFVALAVTFCVCLILANLLEIKTVSLGALTITAGVTVFPLSYVINDCLVEIYGLRRATRVILLGFVMNLLAVILMQLAIVLPGSAEWSGQQAMETVFGATPRILTASFAAFLAGSLVNALVMHRMARSGSRSRSARSFSLRAMVSTVAGEGLDSAIFFPVAFAGVLSTETVLSLIITQTLLKTAYEAAVLPLTIAVVKRLRRTEAAFAIT